MNVYREKGLNVNLD